MRLLNKPHFVIYLPMKHIILGTAGHVDHGKTSLIKALTGIDCDRLKEEKERGITIELGFAHFTLPRGQKIGVVDVPGHERLVRTMVAGATGIDILVLVIAADEGVMPQTREHLDICSLLGINRGLVALTKIDLVDDDWLEMVKSDVSDFLQGSVLDGAPLIPVSAATGQGLTEFVAALDQIASRVEEGHDCGVMRLPVDRVFTMKGFGTVVTGTLISGTVRPGDSVEILPSGLAAKIRGLQVYNQPAVQAQLGQRAALNIQGIEKEKINRGDVVAQPGYLKAARRLDIYLTHLPIKRQRLKHRALVRFHTGTSEIMARVHLIDREELAPGDSCYAQLFLSQPAACMARDRFVIRSYSPVTTIGGGIIIDPAARKLKRRLSSVINNLEVLKDGGNEERLLVLINRAGNDGVRIKELTAKTGLNQKALRPLVEAILIRKQAVVIQPEDTLLVSAAAFLGMQGKILANLLDYHRRFPLQPGISKEELRNSVGVSVSIRLFNLALQALEKQRRIAIDQRTVKSADHTVDLDRDSEDTKQEILQIYLRCGLTPPETSDVLAGFAERREMAKKIFPLLVKDGLLVRIKENYYLHRNALEDLQNRYAKLLREKGQAAPADFKELTGLSRKYVIPLMEYFDLIKFTIRTGDNRILKSTK